MIDLIASLRARIRLEQPVPAGDDLGGAAVSYSDQGSVWAEIVAGAGGQAAAYDAAPSIISYRMDIRRRADVRAGWRVVWGARRMSVTAVRDEGGPRIQLYCEEETL